MNYLQLNRSSTIYRQIAVKIVVGAVFVFKKKKKKKNLFWKSLEQLQSGISLQAAWQKRKSAWKGSNPALLLSTVAIDHKG